MAIKQRGSNPEYLIFNGSFSIEGERIICLRISRQVNNENPKSEYSCQKNIEMVNTQLKHINDCANRN